jgi:Holliday junction resolvase
MKMSEEETKKIVIDEVKNSAELQKVGGNIEGISKFAEKFGGRYEIRMKIDKTVLNYLSEIKLLLRLLDENKLLKELCLNLMKVLGFTILNFYIYIYTSINLMF